MADSQLILELMFLHIRGGCSLTVLLFFLMPVGTCFILSASLCVVRPTYRASHLHENSETTQLFWVVGTLLFLADGSKILCCKPQGLYSIETRCNGFINLFFKL